MIKSVRNLHYFLYTIMLSAMPDLIHLVHGNVLSIQKIITEFREFWYRKTNPTAPGSPTASDSILLSPVETAATDVEMSDGKSSPIQVKVNICTCCLRIVNLAMEIFTNHLLSVIGITYVHTCERKAKSNK